MNNLEYIAEVRQIVREAGKTVRKHFGKIDRYETKSTQFDPVTEIDRGVEQYLKQAFTSLIPQSRFLAEETASEMKSAKYLWIIDPIDGTINFLHGFPFVCVSVALYIDDKPYYGIVFDPIRDELFEAAPGKGSYLNDKPIRVSRNTKLEQCLLATGFPYDYATSCENNFRYFNHFHQKVQGIRRPGSAALDLCCVAFGRFDGFWEWRLNPWDVAAGKLIVEEAGGIVTNFDGESHNLDDSGILAANPSVHPLMLTEIGILLKAKR